MLVFRRRDGRVVRANPAAEALAGCDAHGLDGRSLDELFAAEPGALPPLRAEPDADFRGRLRRPGGEALPVQGRLGPAGGDDEPLGLLVVRPDPEPAAAELAAPRRSERFANAIIDRAPLAIQVFDAAGYSVRMNERMRELLGVPSVKHGTGRFNALTDPFGIQTGLSERFRRALAGETVTGDGLEVDLAAASERWRTRRERVHLDSLLFPVTDEAGAVQAVVSIVRDVTERRRAERDRAALERSLLEMQKLESLGVLAGGVAHDFNNLLTAVLGYAELARAQLPAGAPARGYLLQIEQSARRAADLCGQMLAYAGKGRFVVERVDVAELVRAAADLLRLTAAQRGELTLVLAEGLPPVRADAAQLRQALLSLAANAAEALPPAGGRITVAVSRRRMTRAELAAARLGAGLPEGDYVCLAVGDDGVGMTDEVRARIFEPFFTTRFIGRGLGLAAVLGIVRGHRGALEVESEPGRGSTFRLMLPADELPPTPAPAPAGAPAADAGTALVADDEAGVRSLAAILLRGLGFRTLQAADGAEALEQARREGPGLRLVLLDLSMPRLDGEQALPELRRLLPEATVILMSGYSEREVSERFVGRGVAAFLQKPFTRDDLVRKVREALGE
jgi:signal transduction histidine kinase/CheY-like chemotaxis protein